MIQGSRTRVPAAVISAAALAIGLAACSSDDPQPAVTVTETAEAPNGSPDTDTSPDIPAPVTPSDPVPADLQVTLDGRDVTSALTTTRCEWGSDDGAREVEFDAGRNDDDDLEIELVLTDPPRLDDLSFDEGGVEWEATTTDRRGAQITIDGDTFTIDSQVTEDDGPRTARLQVTFTCR